MNLLIFLSIISQTPQWELTIDPGAINAGARRANILGVTNIWSSLPNPNSAIIINSVTFDFRVGDEIQSSTARYFCREVGSVKEWIKFLEPADIVDIDVSFATAAITILNATTIYNATAVTNILHATTIYSSTAIITNITSITINSTTMVVDGIPITPIPTTQWYTGDHSITNITLDNPAYDGTMHILCITDPDISHSVEWVEDYHYTTNKDGDGYIISITPMDKWYINTTFRIWYTKKQ